MTRQHELPESLLVTTTCQSCGASATGEGQYCADCGSPLVAPALDSVVPEQRTSQEMVGLDFRNELVAQPSVAGRSRARKLTATAACALLVAGVATLAMNDRGTHQRLSHTRAALQASQQRLHSTESVLSQTQADLSDANADLASTKANLTKVEATLKSKEQTLVGVQNSLSDAKTSVTVQAGQIQSLKSCLNGVQIALSDVAYGDYSGAVAALNAVQVSCNAASEIV
jgi:hypothetical protein